MSNRLWIMPDTVMWTEQSWLRRVLPLLIAYPFSKTLVPYKTKYILYIM